LNKRNANFLEILLDSAGRHSMPVCLHVNEPVGHNYAGKHFTDFSILYHVLANCGNTVVILAHWGGGILFYELMKEVQSSLKNVYYDTAASPFIYKDDIYMSAVKITGSGKILFGSDFPLINFNRYIQSISNCVSDEYDKANILGNNAVKILKKYIKNQI
jgi:uncharacterized protein